jgi:methionine-rich copper-binding protein CopC
MSTAHIVVVISLSMLLNAALASAHSFPQKESPAAGESLSTSPSQISIKFDAPIELLFAQLQVIAPDGKNEALSSPQVGADGSTLSVRVPQLAPGDYTVKWSVVCIDTHHTSGAYEFTINRGSS